MFSNGTDHLGTRIDERVELSYKVLAEALSQTVGIDATRLFFATVLDGENRAWGWRRCAAAFEGSGSKWKIR